MFECHELPAEYRGIDMHRDRQVSFCLPCPQDEGICPLALIQHMVTLHNAVVAAVDERMLMSARHERFFPCFRPKSPPVLTLPSLAGKSTMPQSEHGSCPLVT
jgi:hypothetical protein